MERNWDLLPSQPCPETMLFPPDHGGLSYRPFMELKIDTQSPQQDHCFASDRQASAWEVTAADIWLQRFPVTPSVPTGQCLAWLQLLEPHVTSTRGLGGPAPTVPMLAPQPSCTSTWPSNCPSRPLLHPPSWSHSWVTTGFPETVKSITSTSPASVCGEWKRETDRQTDQLGSSGLGFKTDGRTNLKSRESWIAGSHYGGSHPWRGHEENTRQVRPSGTPSMTRSWGKNLTGKAI